MWGFFTSIAFLLIVEVHGEVMAFCAEANSYKEVNIFRPFFTTLLQTNVSLLKDPPIQQGST